MIIEYCLKVMDISSFREVYVYLVEIRVRGLKKTQQNSLFYKKLVDMLYDGKDDTESIAVPFYYKIK